MYIILDKALRTRAVGFSYLEARMQAVPLQIVGFRVAVAHLLLHIPITQFIVQ